MEQRPPHRFPADAADRERSGSDAPKKASAPEKASAGRLADVRQAGFVRPVTLLMAAQVLDKGLYLVREGLVTARFGASGATDAFAVGLYVSNFVLALLRPLIEDALIPIYVERLAGSEGTASDGAKGLLRVVGLAILVVTGGAALLVAVFARPIAQFVAPGFPLETLALTVEVVRAMALFTLILGLCNFFLSVLAARHAYLLVGLSPLAATAVVICFVWFLSDGWGIHSLTWGMVAGTLVQLILLGIGLWRRRQRGVGHRRALGQVDDGAHAQMFAIGLVRFAGLMMVVRLVSMGVGWLDRSLSSRLVEGSLAALSFATNIYQLPLQVCVLAVTTVAIVQFSWHVARDDVVQLRHDFSLAVRIAAFFLLPATVALILIGQPLVQALYERGAFEAGDTAMTVSALSFYTLGLFPQAIVFVAVRLFLARKEAHWILAIFGVGAIVRIGLDLALVGPLQQAGIALATSMGIVAMSGTGLWLVRRKLGPLGGRAMATSLLRIGMAALGMGGVLYATLVFASSLARLSAVWVLALCVPLGLATYLVAAYMLRVDELRSLAAGATEILALTLRLQEATDG